MRYLVLDPRNGDRSADVFVIEPGARRPERRIRFGYVPELRQDPANGELLMVETELRREGSDQTRYWLKRFDPATFRLLGQVETPVRPMYAGFPGRSNRLSPSRSGRYVYVLQLGRHPERRDVYRTTVHRYDRRADVLEAGATTVDSCMVEFGPSGPTDDDLYFHLSCEYPSTVAYGHFGREDLELTPLCELSARTSHARETSGSWLDRESGTLYCVSGDGTIYRVRPREAPQILARLPLVEPACVPLHAIQGAGSSLFVAVSASLHERGLGLASVLWPVSLDDGSVGRRIALPVPVINFVLEPDGGRLLGVNPYLRRFFVQDLATGAVVQSVDDVGCTPAEVLVVTDRPGATGAVA